MQVVRFNVTHYETDGYGNSRAIFRAGAYYSLDAATQRQVDLGAAEIVDAPADPDKAAATADKAESKADEAQVAAAAARAAADAAAAAAVKAG